MKLLLPKRRTRSKTGAAMALRKWTNPATVLQSGVARSAVTGIAAHISPTRTGIPALRNKVPGKAHETHRKTKNRTRDSNKPLFQPNERKVTPAAPRLEIASPPLYHPTHSQNSS